MMQGSVGEKMKQIRHVHITGLWRLGGVAYL
jgi:hypothetical protein